MIAGRMLNLAQCQWMPGCLGKGAVIIGMTGEGVGASGVEESGRRRATSITVHPEPGLSWLRLDG